MALPRRCFCMNLRMATFVNLVTITILAGCALLLRLLDLGTIADSDFQINQSFRNPWRSHQWQAFLISDLILLVCHFIIILFAIYLIYLVTQKHFVLYLETLRTFAYVFILYIFIELSFSVFEFSFYGLNTFRLAYVVFLWLFWLARTIGNISMSVIFFARIQEVEYDMSTEIRASDRKYMHSYTAFG